MLCVSFTLICAVGTRQLGSQGLVSFNLNFPNVESGVAEVQFISLKEFGQLQGHSLAIQRKQRRTASTNVVYKLICLRLSLNILGVRRT